MSASSTEGKASWTEELKGMLPYSVPKTVTHVGIDMATPILNFIFHTFAMYSHQYYEKIIIWKFFTSQISKNKIK